MSTKAFMQSEIDRLQAALDAAREQVNALKTKVTHLEMERDTTYPDYPPRDLMPWPAQSHRWSKAHDALMARMESLKTWLERNYGTAEQGFGVALSNVFHYCGDNVLLTAAYGCEDSNWSSEAHTLMQMYERNINRYNDPDPSPDQQETVNWWAC